ncbi:MAG: hypothetical protein CM15mL4_0050 [uncultured marine virus]|nr:MAG: hypothetical protein CM15mL4_0050 [uncultured marine virus]
MIFLNFLKILFSKKNFLNFREGFLWEKTPNINKGDKGGKAHLFWWGILQIKQKLIKIKKQVFNQKKKRSSF